MPDDLSQEINKVIISKVSDKPLRPNELFDEVMASVDADAGRVQSQYRKLLAKNEVAINDDLKVELFKK